MLMIETSNRVASGVRAIPAAARIGLVLMLAGAAMAVFGHLLGGPHAGHHGTGGLDITQMGHLLALIGMVIAWTGIVIDGARRQRRP